MRTEAFVAAKDSSSSHCPRIPLASVLAQGSRGVSARVNRRPREAEFSVLNRIVQRDPCSRVFSTILG